MLFPPVHRLPGVITLIAAPDFSLPLRTRTRNRNRNATGKTYFGERMPRQERLELPLGIRCNRCSHEMPQFSTVHCINRYAHAKTSDGKPIVSYAFNCRNNACERLIMLCEDPDNSGYYLKFGATKLVEPKEPGLVGEIVDGDILNHETLVKEPEIVGEIVHGDVLDHETSNCNLTKEPELVGEIVDADVLDHETSDYNLTKKTKVPESRLDGETSNPALKRQKLNGSISSDASSADEVSL